MMMNISGIIPKKPSEDAEIIDGSIFELSLIAEGENIINIPILQSKISKT
jgi:hypothetical protein